MIKRILVGLGDLQYSRSATQHAVELARLHEASVTAVTLVDPARMLPGPVPIGGSEAARQLIEYRLRLTTEIVDQAAQEFETTARQEGIACQVVRERGNPFERMISCSRYHDMIICGLRYLFHHGVVDEPPAELARLVDGGVRPLLAVTSTHHKIQRILIAYSGSQESAKTMKRFVQMRLWPNLKLRIATFDGDSPKVEKRLEAAVDYCRAHGYEPESEVVSGSPKDGLLPYATQWDSDLIVLGNSARNYLLKRILGETALHVMATSDRPLFMSQ